MPGWRKNKSSKKPTIAKGKHSNGTKLPWTKQKIVPIIEKEIPPPLGFGFLCELLSLGVSIKRFLNDPSAKRHFPSSGDATICGSIVDADEKTGLAKSIEPFIYGGKLYQKN